MSKIIKINQDNTMPALDTKTNSFYYPSTTIERAKRSLICSPFKLHLLDSMRDKSVSIVAIALDSGVENGYTKRPLSELTVDNELSWLIQVGVLRREVDGQGITDSFRLTPLGRQLVELGEIGNSWGTPSWVDRFYNALSRWLRLPF